MVRKLSFLHNETRPPRRKRTLGQRAADKLTLWMGSWTFIIIFVIILTIWVGTNGYYITKYFGGKPFDPFPFILLNLFLSCLAAIQAPVILMSGNRQGEKDRKRFEYDYSVNRKAEHEIADMQKDLEIIKDLIRTVNADYDLNMKTDKGVESVRRHISEIRKHYKETSKHLETLKKDVKHIKKGIK